MQGPWRQLLLLPGSCKGTTLCCPAFPGSCRLEGDCSRSHQRQVGLRLVLQGELLLCMQQLLEGSASNSHGVWAWLLLLLPPALPCHTTCSVSHRGLQQQLLSLLLSWW